MSLQPGTALGPYAVTAKLDRSRRGWVCGPALIGFLLLGVGCERSDVDVPRDLRVADITTGWFDAGSDDVGL